LAADEVADFSLLWKRDGQERGDVFDALLDQIRECGQPILGQRAGLTVQDRALGFLVGAGLLQVQRDLPVEPPTLSVGGFRHKYKAEAGDCPEFHLVAGIIVACDAGTGSPMRIAFQS
jgi:hypothetical protein